MGFSVALTDEVLVLRGYETGTFWDWRALAGTRDVSTTQSGTGASHPIAITRPKDPANRWSVLPLTGTTVTPSFTKEGVDSSSLSEGFEKSLLLISPFLLRPEVREEAALAHPDRACESSQREPLDALDRSQPRCLAEDRLAAPDAVAPRAPLAPVSLESRKQRRSLASIVARSPASPAFD